MNILTINDRAATVEAIEAPENLARKANSLKQSEVFNDRLYQYVVEELERHFSPETVQEMPIVSFINFPRRIVKNISSIYRTEPSRTFPGLSDDQVEKLNMIYEDCEADWKFKKANEFYSLQEQTHVMIIPSNGKLVMRNLMQHQVDAIPNPHDPEIADAYIISSFDKELYLTYERNQSATGNEGRSNTAGLSSDGQDSAIADSEDYKKSSTFYTYWDKEYNFIFNGHGLIVNPENMQPYEGEVNKNDLLSPIPGTMPIVDFSRNKDFEYFVRPGNAIVDFGIQYNSAFSDVWHISRMQGYSVGVLKGPDELMPDTIKLGPNYMIRLKTNNAEGSTVRSEDVDFNFVSPNPDIQSSLNLLETMLTNFISSRGIDPKEVAQSGTKSYNSALERLLAMIEKFEASKDDIKLFRKKEAEVFDVFKAWINSGTQELDAKYSMPALPDDASVNVEFYEPQMLLTQDEKLAYWERRIDNRSASLIQMIMDLEGLDKEDAIEFKKDVDEQNNTYEKLSIPRPEPF